MVMPCAYISTILSSKPVLGNEDGFELAFAVARHLDAKLTVIDQNGLGLLPLR